MDNKLLKKVNNAIDELMVTAERNMIQFAFMYPNYNVHKAVNFSYGRRIGGYANSKDLSSLIGLWSGIFWNLYSFTGDVRYRFYANTISEALKRYVEGTNMNASDIGVATLPAMMYKYKIEKSKGARKALMTAANSLLTNYIPSFGCISVWGDDIEKKHFNIKIKDLINIMLLRFAYKENKKKNVSSVADTSIEKILKYTIIDNENIYYRHYFDSVTSESLGGYYSVIEDEYKNVVKFPFSVSYALFGLALNFSVTGKNEYLELFMSLAKPFFDNYDYKGCYFMADGKSAFDTTSTLIAVCAVMELRKTLKSKNEMLESFYQNALCMLEYIIDNKRLSPKTDYVNGFVGGGVWYDWDIHTDRATIIGDYFYLEALLRYLDKYKGFWY